MNNFKLECDWCDRQATHYTTYGTTHYTRVICSECIERLNDYRNNTNGLNHTTEQFKELFGCLPIK